MSDNQPQLSTIVSTSSLFIVLLLGSYVLIDPPLQSRRVPSEQDAGLYSARLWEDPLKTVYSINAVLDSQLIDDPVKDLSSLLSLLTPTSPRQLYDIAVGGDESAKLLLLGVSVPGGNYNLTIETRRRIRYSVISALNQTHIPSNSEALPVINFSGGQGVENSRLLVGAEIFEPYTISTQDSDWKTNILVLWIPAESLQAEPLANYAQIVGQLSEDTTNISVILLGPPDSNGLTNLYREISQFDAGESLGLGDSVREITATESFLQLSIDYLVDTVFFYLDDGLSEEKETELRNCVPGAELFRLTAQKVSECLESLQIQDSDADWHNTIASDWPRQYSEQIETALATVSPELRDDVSRLMDSANSYLDSGLSEEERISLINCFVSENNISRLIYGNVSSCLANLEIINDSDNTWHDTIALNWPIEFTDSNQDEVGLLSQLIESADSYLDNGLEESKRLDLISCIQSENISTLSQQIVNDCLFGLDIEDSDLNWYETIASEWPEKLTGEALAAFYTLNEELQPSVEELINSSDRYLDFGLNTDNHLRLINCFLADSNIDSLTRQVVSTCLKGLPIEDSDSTWYDWVAQDWPLEEVSDKSNFDRRKITVISPRATIPDFMLNSDLAIVSDAPDYSKVIRSIQSDDWLATRIFNELMVRKLNATESKIALVYESDNKYGRAFQQALDCKLAPADRQNLCFRNVESYGYLRGIDGTVPSDAGRASSSVSTQNNGNQSVAALTPNRSQEEPFGRGQFDYLRRIAQEIEKGEYDAVGVIGSDIYDKLLVLQALQEKNSQAVFFTTDMDAYFLDNDQSQWTQNLLVASAFPLTMGSSRTAKGCELIDPTLKNPLSVPPFRDSYQTSYFYATCLASLSVKFNEAEIKNKNETLLSNNTYMYEIGRNSVVELKTIEPGFSFFATDGEAPDMGNASFSLYLSWLLVMSPVIFLLVYAARIYGEENTKFATRRNLFDVLYLFFLCLLLAVSAWNLQVALESGLVMNPIQWSLLIVSVGLTGLISYFCTKRFLMSRELNNSNSYLYCFVIGLYSLLAMSILLVLEYFWVAGEPLHVFEGLSHWPGTLIRFQVLVISLSFGLLAYTRWHLSNEDLSKLLGYASDEDVFVESRRSRDAKYYKGSSISGWMNHIRKNSGNSRTMQEIWISYRRLELWNNRLLRVIPKATAFTLILFTVYKTLTPSPALIRESYPLANFLFSDVFVFIVAFVALMMISIGNDVTGLGRTFIFALRSYAIEWEKLAPKNLLDEDFGNNSEIYQPICILEFIARRTQAITPLILFPFIIIFLMIWARSSLFEGWSWSAELVMVYSLISAYTLYSAATLRREASLARNQAIDSITNLQLHDDYLSLQDSVKKNEDLRMQFAKDYATNLNKGAFVPWFRHPILQALIVPSTGTSGLLLLQYLTS